MSSIDRPVWETVDGVQQLGQLNGAGSSTTQFHIVTNNRPPRDDDEISYDDAPSDLRSDPFRDQSQGLADSFTDYQDYEASLPTRSREPSAHRPLSISRPASQSLHPTRDRPRPSRTINRQSGISFRSSKTLPPLPEGESELPVDRTSTTTSDDEKTTQRDRFFEHHSEASRTAPAAKKKGMWVATPLARIAALRDAVAGNSTTKKGTTVQWSSAPASETAPSKGGRSKGTPLFSRKTQEKGKEKEKEPSEDDKRARARARRAEVQSWLPTEWVPSDEGTDLARSPSTGQPPRDISPEKERRSSLSEPRKSVLKHKTSDVPSSAGGSELRPDRSPAMQRRSLHARKSSGRMFKEEAELPAVPESVSWSPGPEKRPSQSRRSSRVLTEKDNTDIPSIADSTTGKGKRLSQSQKSSRNFRDSDLPSIADGYPFSSTSFIDLKTPIDGKSQTPIEVLLEDDMEDIGDIPSEDLENTPKPINHVKLPTESDPAPPAYSSNPGSQDLEVSQVPSAIIEKNIDTPKASPVVAHIPLLKITSPTSKNSSDLHPTKATPSIVSEDPVPIASTSRRDFKPRIIESVIESSSPSSKSKPLSKLERESSLPRRPNAPTPSSSISRPFRVVNPNPPSESTEEPEPAPPPILKETRPVIRTIPSQTLSRLDSEILPEPVAMPVPTIAPSPVFAPISTPAAAPAPEIIKTPAPRRVSRVSIVSRTGQPHLIEWRSGPMEVQSALYGSHAEVENEYTAEERIVWCDHPSEREEFAEFEQDVRGDALEVELGKFAYMHTFDEDGGKGAIFIPAEARDINEGADGASLETFWMTFEEARITGDVRIMELIAEYDPGDEFMVFAYILYEEDWRVIEVFPLLFTLERVPPMWRKKWRAGHPMPNALLLREEYIKALEQPIAV